jgi:hypothetical protein
MRLALTVIFATLWGATGATDIFVFSPESKTGQIQNARLSLEKYLAGEGLETKVHIFANAIDFEAAVKRQKPEFAIISSYYFTAAAKDFQWKLLLSGHLGGEESFRKILMVENSVTKATDLRDKAVATTSFGPSTPAFVSQQFLQPVGLAAGSIRLVTVSKDIDGLMALAVGQVAGAIVTQDSIDRLKNINASAFAGMKELRKLPPLPYPKLVFFPHAADVIKVKNIFRRTATSPDAADFNRFIGITGFQ